MFVWKNKKNLVCSHVFLVQTNTVIKPIHWAASASMDAVQAVRFVGLPRLVSTALGAVIHLWQISTVEASACADLSQLAEVEAQCA